MAESSKRNHNLAESTKFTNKFDRLVELPERKASCKDTCLKGEMSGKFHLGSITKTAINAETANLCRESYQSVGLHYACFRVGMVLLAKELLDNEKGCFIVPLSGKIISAIVLNVPALTDINHPERSESQDTLADLRL